VSTRATPKEAFEGAIEGAIYANQMAFLRGHGAAPGAVRAERARQHLLGSRASNDANAIWFHQYIAAEHRFFRYYENAHKDLAHYVKYIKDEPRRARSWGTHYLPHDAEQENLERMAKPRRSPGGAEAARRHRGGRAHRGRDGGRRADAQDAAAAYFDRGLRAGHQGLDNYKFEWDEKAGCWRNTPAHTWASNPPTRSASGRRDGRRARRSKRSATRAGAIRG
jgi:hypothetical protein